MQCRIKKIISVAFILIFTFLALFPMETQAQGKITMGWLWTNNANTNTYIQQINNTKNLDVISPTGIYLMDGTGKLENKIDNKLVQYARQKGIKVWALFSVDNFNQDIAHAVLSDRKLQAQVIEDVVALAVDNNYDGINIDWEGLLSADRDAYTQFVLNLTSQLQKNNKTVSIDVAATTSDYENIPANNWSYSVDRDKIDSAVDYIVLMGYDEHTIANPHGPVASLPWVEKAIQYLLNKIPAEKVLLGVPFYTHDVSGNDPQHPYEYLGLNETQERIAQFKASVYWDDSIGQSVATYFNNQTKHTIWVEDDKSMALRMDLVNKYKLAGMAAWSLSSESASTWAMIGAKLGKIAAPHGAITINVNGTPVSPDVPPYIDKNSRTMVPIRFVSAALGATADWSAAAHMVTIKKGSTTLNLIINQKSYVVNGAVKSLDTSAVIKGGRTMVPLRLISEGLGASVDWQEDTRTINIDLSVF